MDPRFGSARTAWPIALAALVCVSGTVGAERAVLARDATGYREREVIVKYRASSFRARDTMRALYDLAGVKKVRRFQGMMRGFEQLELDERTKIEDAIASLRDNPLVEYAQPNYLLHAQPAEPVRPSAPARSGAGACMPGVDAPGCDPQECLFPEINFPPGCHASGRDAAPAPARPAVLAAPPEPSAPQPDPELGRSYGLRLTGVDEVWKKTRGNRSLIVADIDTGADYNHEDLAPSLWRNPAPTAQGDIVGFDFVHNDGLPFDDNQHGTHSAGIIAAARDNGKGTAGVAPGVSLMVLKFLGSDGNGTTADAVRAIDYAVSHGAKILNNSWGGTGDDNNRALSEAIDRARDHDVLFIAAAGNDGANNDGDDPTFPAAFSNDNLISVAATDASDHLAFFSNYGKRTTHLAAPGVAILSTLPGNRYAPLSGTSMAAPHVAGAAALLWSQHPGWTYGQVKNALLAAVDPVPELAGKVSTGGRLNVLKAFLAAE